MRNKARMSILTISNQLEIPSTIKEVKEIKSIQIGTCKRNRHKISIQKSAVFIYMNKKNSK